jgi:hypothetical protein
MRSFQVSADAVDYAARVGDAAQDDPQHHHGDDDDNEDLHGPLPLLACEKSLASPGKMSGSGSLEALPKVAAVYPDARVRAATDDQGRPLGLESDPRLTPVGRFIRRLSLDELPQFWNVLLLLQAASMARSSRFRISRLPTRAPYLAGALAMRSRPGSWKPC